MAEICLLERITLPRMLMTNIGAAQQVVVASGLPELILMAAVLPLQERIADIQGTLSPVWTCVVRHMIL
jgi:hypothetical protein